MDNILKENGLKITKQRLELLNMISNLEEDATIKNISTKLKIDISTIYRIIDIFLEKNIIEKDINYENKIYYKVKEKHKHYMKCIKCHKKIEIEFCPIEKFDDDRFKIVNHKVEIDGICSSCNKS